VSHDPADDKLLTVADAAEFVGLSVAGFWRAVAAGRMPDPVYPAAAAPRWFRSEVRAALLASRCKPAQAQAARRRARLAQAAA
jgi:predicted DNA-binding transcriptional regulator AlpA